MNIVHELPSDSLYQPIAAEYRARQGSTRGAATPHAVFARGLVPQILTKNPPKWVWNVVDGVDIEFLPEGTHGKSTLCLVSCFSGGLTRELCIILDRQRLVWDGEVEAGCQNGKDGISVVVLLGFLSTQYLSPL
ncbi:hypothetical protein CPB85DRAFT_166685 [Mucidula mucida]|nr:hypothetical protein CPB85DRAFT_166685 [Mucidula mucida]